MDNNQEAKKIQYPIAVDSHESVIAEIHESGDLVITGKIDKKKIVLSKEKVADIILSNAFRLIEVQQILYYEILSRVQIIVDDKFPYVGGIGFNPQSKKINMIFGQNSLFSNKFFINENKTISFIGKSQTYLHDVAGLIEHELAHLLYDHIFFFDEKKDNSEDNRAKDYIINASGHFLGRRYSEIKNPENESILSHGCFYEELRPKIKELENRDIHSLNAPELYEILMKNKDKFKQNSGFDKHGTLKVTIDENGNAQISEEDLEGLDDQQKADIRDAVKKTLAESIENLKRKGKLAQAIGQLGGDVKNLITEMLKSKTDRQAILNFAHSVRNGVKKTFSKLHRRYPYIAKGRLKDKRAVIVYLIDTSGSMDNPEIRKMTADQLYKLLEVCQELYVVVGDTKLQYSIKLESVSDFDLEKISFSGGGGTNLQFGWDFAEEVGADGVVCHTDGVIGEFDDKGIASLFYLYGEGILEVGGYENYKVYPE